MIFEPVRVENVILHLNLASDQYFGFHDGSIADFIGSLSHLYVIIEVSI